MPKINSPGKGEAKLLVILGDDRHHKLQDRATYETRSTGTHITMAELVRRAIDAYLTA
jgi:hypothetical protein